MIVQAIKRAVCLSSSIFAHHNVSFKTLEWINLLSGYRSVALGHRCPGSCQPGNGALKLGLAPDPDLAQAWVIHGGRRGDGQRGGQACVGGAPQELGGQATGYGARSGS